MSKSRLFSSKQRGSSIYEAYKKRSECLDQAIFTLSKGKAPIGQGISVNVRFDAGTPTASSSIQVQTDLDPVSVVHRSGLEANTSCLVASSCVQEAPSSSGKEEADQPRVLELERQLQSSLQSITELEEKLIEVILCTFLAIRKTNVVFKEKHTLLAQLQEKDTQLQEKDAQLQEKDVQLQETNTQAEELREWMKEAETRFTGVIEEKQSAIQQLNEVQIEYSRIAEENDFLMAQLDESRSETQNTRDSLNKVEKRLIQEKRAVEQEYEELDDQLRTVKGQRDSVAGVLREHRECKICYSIINCSAV
ncbi:hypothetical protein BDZ97DRAFT_1919824 [Flammula alnicola]|nr:hypothetical protein BDZ97DRAFT_1919824 [Flammula alnicola]